MLDNLEYSFSVDMWSVGVIIYQMLTGKLMFDSSSEIEYLIEVMRMKGTPTTLDVTYFAKFKTLLKIGPALPHFKSSSLLNAENNLTAQTAEESDRSSPNDKRKLNYGFDKLIDQLTSIDPTKRPSAKQSIKKLKKIRGKYEARFNTTNDDSFDL